MKPDSPKIMKIIDTVLHKNSETHDIVRDNTDYTLFSWSKQKGLNPIAV